MNTKSMALDYIKRAQLVPASDIFSKNDAEEALMSAEELFSSCSNLIKEIFEHDK